MCSLAKTALKIATQIIACKMVAPQPLPSISKHIRHAKDFLLTWQEWSSPTMHTIVLF